MKCPYLGYKVGIAGVARSLTVPRLPINNTTEPNGKRVNSARPENYPEMQNWEKSNINKKMMSSALTYV